MTERRARHSRRSPLKPPFRRCRPQRTPGTPATPSASAWPTPSTREWRNRDEHIVGREEIVAFLTRKWQRELDYSLRKSLWSFSGNRIAVRFQYECHDHTGQWFRSYGNELWEFSRRG